MSCTCGGAFTLSPGQTRGVTVSFRPTATGPGSAILRLTSDDPDTGTLDVALSGLGVEAPVGGGEIVLEQVVEGGSTASAVVTTGGSLTGANGDLYLAAVTSKSFRSIVSVTGLGLVWSPDGDALVRSE